MGPFLSYNKALEHDKLIITTLEVWSKKYLIACECNISSHVLMQLFKCAELNFLTFSDLHFRLFLTHINHMASTDLQYSVSHAKYPF